MSPSNYSYKTDHLLLLYSDDIMRKLENLMKTSEFLTFKIKFFRGIFIVMNLKSLNLIFRYHLRVAPFLKLNAVSIFLHHLGNWENKALSGL